MSSKEVKFVFYLLKVGQWIDNTDEVSFIILCNIDVRTTNLLFFVVKHSLP